MQPRTPSSLRVLGLGLAVGLCTLIPPALAQQATPLSETSAFPAERGTGPTPAGSEFVVNETTVYNQQRPVVSRNGDGRFVVVWEDEAKTSQEIFARIYASDGTPITGEFQVNSYSSGRQRMPDVAMAPDGSFVVAWQGEGALDPDGAHAQRFNSSGVALGNQIQVNSYPPNSQQNPNIGIDADGNFTIAYRESGDGSSSIRGRRFSADGTAQGLDFEIAAVDDPDYLTMDMNPSGRFVVAWQFSYKLDFGLVDGRLYDSTGTAAGPAFEIARGSGYAYNPNTAMADDGSFVVAWSVYPDGAPATPVIERFNSVGSPIGAEFTPAGLTDSAFVTDVGIRPNGDFLVIWEEFGTRGELLAQAYASDGSSLGGELSMAVNSYSNSYGRLGFGDDSGFTVTWHSVEAEKERSGDGMGHDGNDRAAIARLFQFCPDGDFDGFCDNVDICLLGDDSQDTDMDTVPDACDACEGSDDAQDDDMDTVPDGCDVCADSDDTQDADMDTVPDGCDVCAGSDDTQDADDDTVPDGCDVCAGSDDTQDADMDTVPDGCDVCAGSDDTQDADDDTVPDGCDVCAGSDDTQDADDDTVPDGCDVCAGSDDTQDADDDTVPDGCDVCAGSDDTQDADMDTVPDGCDVCAGSDDTQDADMDAVPDGCDICALGNDNVDDDMDGVPNACDACAGSDDSQDMDDDTVPDGCDVCPGGDDTVDENDNGIPDACDDLVAPQVSSIAVLSAGGTGALTECGEIRSALQQLRVTFNEAMDEGSVSDPGSYRLVAAGADGSLDTTTCAAPMASDQALTIAGVSYDAVTFTASLTVPSVDDVQRLLVCDTVTDEIGNALTAEVDRTFRVETENLLTNGHLDCDLASWDESPSAGPDIIHDSQDVLASNVSGSVALASPDNAGLSQCVAFPQLNSALDFTLSAAISLATPSTGSLQAQRSCRLFADSTCSGPPLADLAAAEQIVLDTQGTWLSLSDTLNFPAGSASARCGFSLQTLNGGVTARVDQIELIPAVPFAIVIFSDGFESGDTAAWSGTESVNTSIASPLTPNSLKSPETLR